MSSDTSVVRFEDVSLHGPVARPPTVAERRKRVHDTRRVDTVAFCPFLDDVRLHWQCIEFGERLYRGGVAVRLLRHVRDPAQHLLPGNGSDEENIRTAFRRIICRKASSKEEDVLLSYYKEQWQLFRDRKLDAATTLKAGLYPLDKKADQQKLAALMKTISAIYNMEEAITKT